MAPTREFAGRVALVTGAASGIGAAAATLFAERGARVLHPRTIAPLEEARIPAVIANALRPEAPGTRVAAEPGLSAGRSTAVTSMIRSAEAEVVVLGAIGDRGTEKATRALSAVGVSPRALAPSPNPASLSALVRVAEREAAVRALHDAFALPAAG